MSGLFRALRAGLWRIRFYIRPYSCVGSPRRAKALSAAAPALFYG